MLSASSSGNARSDCSDVINPRAPSLKFSFLCLVVSLLLFLLGLGLYIDTTNPFLLHLASKLGYDKQQYSVIVDAGSTGCRVLAYKFNRSFKLHTNIKISDNKLILGEEQFKERKLGLSSFAANPQNPTRQIKWSSTPLLLKATAGLRLLPHSKAENLLNVAHDLFTKSVFSVDIDSVEAMNDTDEGIFSWFTVNFLLGRLSKSNQTAALDLGGRSTQVAFAPTDPEQVLVYEKYMHEVKISLGLMAARDEVFTKGYNPRRDKH
uniref:Ectonucleoside triphosphate diphosphohydrolase 5 n=1 Tax=Glossina pallidipes TaxID=7398 RepID=A0A1A9ZJB7_GLOPL